MPDDRQRWADAPFVYLTTVGRRTGRPHRIEIWFAMHAGRLLLLSGGRDRADWVRNLQANPSVWVELGSERYAATARVLEPSMPEDALARALLVAKYADDEDDLESWGRTSLAVIIEFPPDAAGWPRISPGRQVAGPNDRTACR